MKPGTEGTPTPTPQEKPTKAKKASALKAGSQKDLLARLQHLRSVAQEINQAYLTNLEHDILEVVDWTQGDGKESGKKAKPRAATMNHMIEILEKLSLKPGKGRRKDLRKIERAVEALRKLATR